MDLSLTLPKDTPFRNWFNRTFYPRHTEWLHKTIESRKERLQMLEQIKEMTEVLSYNPTFIGEDRLIHLETEYGVAYTVGVYSNEHMSIAETTFEENTSLAEHWHPEYERVAVLIGELEVIFILEDKRQSHIVKQYESLSIPPGMHHSCRNKVKTVIIADLMPYSSYFPKPYE